MLHRIPLRTVIIVASLLAAPMLARAQEAALSGTVTDSTGGVLPGVTVTATHEATGNVFTAVTDERGAFRIPARIGAYRVVAELSGFTTLNRTGLQLLVGQTAVINLQMSPATVQESVTVTGEAPLVDTTSSALGGNIDQRQMEDLPLNGRNFLDLATLAPGARTNAVDPGGAPTNTGTGTFQINIDGQQVTNNCCGTGHQGSFSRDAIAEFQFIGNRFDAVQGRSSGIQVNVVTKSGTNTPAGTFSGYFRADQMNAKDFIQDRVLPYKNQQYSATFGGPIVLDRVHYFGNYEFEREPSTITFNSPWPSFNIDLPSKRTQHKAATRIDTQLTSRTRFSLYGNLWRDYQPVAPTLVGGAGRHPSTSVFFNQASNNAQGVLTQVLSNQTLNEIRGGWTNTYWNISPNIEWQPTTVGVVRDPRASYAPNIDLRGYTIGPAQNYPQIIGQDIYSIRDDLTTAYALGGRHDVRAGGEYMNYLTWHKLWCNFWNGELAADNGAPPANIEALFPVWDNPSTWNLNALSPLSRQYQASLGNCNVVHPRDIFGVWYQDDWQVSSRLTLNLGVRYDYETDAFANEVAVPRTPGALGEQFLQSGRPNDNDNISPRVGFAYSLNDRTVIRGGGGKYYSWLINQTAHPVRFADVQRVVNIPYDRRADFAINPFAASFSRYPTITEFDAQSCAVNYVTGCTRRAVGQTLVAPNAENPYSYQASIGVQRQIGTTMSFQADYAFNGLRHERVTGYNVNLAFDPATGLNLPFNNTAASFAARPYPNWNQVIMDIFEGWSNSNSLVMAFNKRMSNRWQASATYTLSYTKDGVPAAWSGVVDTPYGTGGHTPFPLQAPFNEEYSYAASDQRHRAVFNGIWEVGYGFQLSGLYFYGQGERFATNYGGDALATGATTRANRVRPNRTIVPRNEFIGEPLHRVDMRLQKRFALGSRVTADGIVEAFNLFNHENYGSYTLAESNAKYGQPEQNLNVAYQPFVMQLGFRLGF